MKLSLSLKSIYIREGRLWIADDFNPLIPGQELLGEYRIIKNHKRMTTDLQLSDSLKRWYAFITKYEFRYRMKPQNPNTEGKLIAEVIASISADYEAIDPESISDDQLAQWGETVIFHTWPYWREYCQTSLTRMNLPTAIMPLLVASQKQEADKPAALPNQIGQESSNKRPKKKVRKD